LKGGGHAGVKEHDVRYALRGVPHHLVRGRVRGGVGVGVGVGVGARVGVRAAHHLVRG
jgi:hypothetical protein